MQKLYRSHSVLSVLVSPRPRREMSSWSVLLSEHSRSNIQATLILSELKKLSLVEMHTVIIFEDLFTIWNMIHKGKEDALWSLFLSIPFDLELVAKGSLDLGTNNANNPLYSAVKVVEHVPSTYTSTKSIAFITALTGNYEKTLKNYVRQIGDVSATFICFAPNNDLVYSPYWVIDRSDHHAIHRSPVDDGSYFNSFALKVKGGHSILILQNIIKSNGIASLWLQKYDYVVWLDGTIEILSHYFASEIAEKLQTYNIVSFYQFGGAKGY